MYLQGGTKDLVRKPFTGISGLAQTLLHSAADPLW